MAEVEHLFRKPFGKSSSADYRKRVLTVATSVRCSSADSVSCKSRTKPTKMIGAEILAEKPEETEETEVDFFDWLMDQSWVKRVASSRGLTKISTKCIMTTEEARQKLRAGGFGTMCPTCTFIEAVECKYEFSADRNDDWVPPHGGVEVKPGDTIATPSNKPSGANRAQFGGAIRLPVAGDFGISVAHLFRDAAGGAIYQSIGGERSARMYIGERKLALSDPYMYMKPAKKWRKITADMCFLQMATNVMLKNEVVISDQMYSLKLYQDNIEEDQPVIIFIKPGVVRQGRIHDEIFSDIVNVENEHAVVVEQIKQYRMMTIIERGGTLRKVTEKGDSGSLVMIKKADDDKNMYVIGIVSGTGTYKDGTGTSFTFANRLMDVLVAVGRNEEFCLNLTDGKRNSVDLSFSEFSPKA